MIKTRLNFETFHENPKFRKNIYIQPSEKPNCIEMWIGDESDAFTVKYNDIFEALNIINDFISRQ